MSDLARRMSAAVEVFEAARRMLAAGEPYDVAQTTSANDLEALAARLNRTAERAEARR
jgi:hypothetical protein